MTLAELTKKVVELAPVCGMKADGTIDFLPEATEAQKQAARDYVTAHLAELNETPARYISKLTIRRRLRALGLEDAADAALASNAQAQKDWDDAEEIAADDAQVRAMLAAIGANPDEILA